MASTHTADLARAVAELVDASLGVEPAAIEVALARIEQRVVDIEPRRSVPLAATVGIFVRDCWTCRYCGARTIAPPVLRVLSSLYPDRFPYHANWKAGRVHPAYLLLSTSLDHVHPGGRGGSWGDETNLVTACWPCNSGKGDFTLEEIGWELLDPAAVRSEWRGLTGEHADLWAAAGEPDAAYHRRWLRALSLY